MLKETRRFKKIWWGGALGSLLFGGSIAAAPYFHAQEPSAQEMERERPPHFRRYHPGWGPRDEMPAPFLRELNLTEAQKAQVAAAREAMSGDLDDAQANLGEAHRALRESVLRGDDEQQIRQQAEAVGAAQGELAVLEARFHASVVEILTPEQRKKLDQLRQEAQETKTRMDGRGAPGQKRPRSEP